MDSTARMPQQALHVRPADETSPPFDTTSMASSKSTGPSSLLLQDLIRERKAESRRLTRNTDTESQSRSDVSKVLDARAIQSSPIEKPESKPQRPKPSRKSSEHGSRMSHTTKEMGAREQEEYISKINKQNFDLKLELFHRRQRADALEKQVEDMKSLQEEHGEIQLINEDLIQELEKRDQAIQEAVEMICRLEEKVDTLENVIVNSTPILPERNDNTPLARTEDEPSQDSAAHSLIVGTSTGNARHQKAKSALSSGSQSPSRQPSFLKDKDSGTTALRSLYERDGDNYGTMGFARYQRPLSNLSRDEDGARFSPDPFLTRSPSLSVLSESSFLSVYGKNESEITHDEPELLKTNVKGEARNRDQTTSIKLGDERREMKTGDGGSKLSHKVARKIPPNPRTHPRLQSIGQVINNKPLEVCVPDTSRADRTQEMLDHISLRREQEQKKAAQMPMFGGPMFGRDILPPTPDTLYTANTASLNSSSSIIAEKSHLDYSGQQRVIQQKGSGGSNDEGLFTDFERKRGQAAIYDRDEEEDYSEQLNEGSYDETPNQFLTSTARAMRAMGLEPSQAPATPYGTNMMFNGNESLPSDFYNSRPRDQRRRSSFNQDINPELYSTQQSHLERLQDSRHPRASHLPTSPGSSGRSKAPIDPSERHYQPSSSRNDTANTSSDINPSPTTTRSSKYSSPQKGNRVSFAENVTVSEMPSGQTEACSSQGQAAAPTSRASLTARLFRRTQSAQPDTLSHATTQQGQPQTPTDSAATASSPTNTSDLSRRHHQIHLHPKQQQRQQHSTGQMLPPPARRSSATGTLNTRNTNTGIPRAGMRPNTAGSFDSNVPSAGENDLTGSNAHGRPRSNFLSQGGRVSGRGGRRRTGEAGDRDRGLGLGLGGTDGCADYEGEDDEGDVWIDDEEDGGNDADHRRGSTKNGVSDGGLKGDYVDGVGMIYAGDAAAAIRERGPRDGGGIDQPTLEGEEQTEATTPTTSTGHNGTDPLEEDGKQNGKRWSFVGIGSGRARRGSFSVGGVRRNLNLGFSGWKKG